MSGGEHLSPVDWVLLRDVALTLLKATTLIRRVGPARADAPGACRLRSNQFLRERLTFVLALLPERTNNRLYARYLQSKAAREIGALHRVAPALFVTGWPEVSINPPPSLPDAAACLREFTLRLVPVEADVRATHES